MRIGWIVIAIALIGWTALVLFAQDARATDQVPTDMPREKVWQLRADYNWWLFDERRITKDPCVDAAFTDIYGEWYGCPPPTEAMLDECMTYFGFPACDRLWEKVIRGNG